MAFRGGVITRRPPCFAPDGKLFFTPCSNDIRIYSAKSGDHIATLKGHTAPVTSVHIDATNHKQLYSSSQDGTLKLWNIEDGSVLRTYVISTVASVESMVISRKHNVAWVSVTAKHATQGRVFAYQLSTGKPLLAPKPSDGEHRLRVKLRSATPLFISASGEYVATIDVNRLLVWDHAIDLTRRPPNFAHTRNYTCAAIDASDSILAAGDISGRILIYHNFAEYLKNKGGAPPACTTLHWHAHPVGALCFSADSTYLMSGGQEAVLVQWHLATGKRNYLPRLGGPLSGIMSCSSNPATYLVVQADNTVRVVNTANMTVTCSVHGLRPAPPLVSAVASTSAAKLQPQTGHLVVPCDNALLQFFDVIRDRHVAKLQVAPRNYVSVTSSSQTYSIYGPPTPPQITHTAFSRDGSSMVTVDVRPDAGPCGSVETSLKFWDATTSAMQAGATAGYELNTVANDAHTGNITALAYHPMEDVVATCSSDCEFKIWVRGKASSRRQRGGAGVANVAAETRQGGWRCSSVGSYKRRQLHCCAFSPDGSILAIGAGRNATLWDPFTDAMLGVLCSPVHGDEHAVLHNLVFVQHTPYLVGLLQGPGTTWRLLVWDLLSTSVAWSCAVPSCGVIVADPCHPLFAIGVPPQPLPAPTPPAAPGTKPDKAVAAAASSTNSSDARSQAAPNSAPAPASCGYVLVFHPAQAWPKYVCPVPGGSPASLLFAPPNTGLGGLAASSVPDDMSPLLLVTEDRKFAIATSADAATADGTVATAEEPGPDGMKALGQQDESWLESAFGRTQVPQVAAVGVAQAGSNVQAALAQLFDAPSHILPPPTALCPTLLELLVVKGDQ